MVEYLTVGKRKLPFRISYRVLKRISTLSKDLGELDLTEKLLYFSLQNGAKSLGEDFDITEEGLEDLIDEYPEMLTQFAEIAPEQMGELTKKIAGGTMGINGQSLSDTDSKTLVTESTT